jgi:hypothetical protein
VGIPLFVVKRSAPFPEPWLRYWIRMFLCCVTFGPPCMYNNRTILFYEIKGLSTKIVRLCVCVCVCQAGENRTKYEALQHLFNRSTWRKEAPLNYCCILCENDSTNEFWWIESTFQERSISRLCTITELFPFMK